MKNLDLNNYGVQEMNAGEIRENNGGLIFIPVLALYFAGASIGCCCLTVGAYVGYKMNQ